MHPLQPGDPTVLGPYVLIARLGTGGMGQVFLGRTRGGRTVAVKTVRGEMASDPEFRRRFRQEVAAARAVSGRFTAPVADADTDAAMPWLATSYVSGLSLRDVVADGWRLPESSLGVLAGGLAGALVDIHAGGVVHRDLKPSNVMLAVDGPRVIDFGISRVMLDVTRTGTGMIVGSPGFMSPEQARGRPLTPATDVFSLGTVLAFAATGHNPFGSGPEGALLYRIVHTEPSLGGIPESLAPLVASCLAKDPADRPTPEQIVEQVSHVPNGAWLPAALTTSIAQSAAEILDYESVARFPEPDVSTGLSPADSSTLVMPAVEQATRPISPMPTPVPVPAPLPASMSARVPMRDDQVAPPPPMRSASRPNRRTGGIVAASLTALVIAGGASALILSAHGHKTPAAPATTAPAQAPQLTPTASARRAPTTAKSTSPSSKPTPTASSSSAPKPTSPAASTDTASTTPPPSSTTPPASSPPSSAAPSSAPTTATASSSS